MSGKRPGGGGGGDLGNLMKKAKNTNIQTAASTTKPSMPKNPLLDNPINPIDQIAKYLFNIFKKQHKLLEVEARLGIFQAPFGVRDMRALSSGAKSVSVKDPKTGNISKVLAHAFQCNNNEQHSPQHSYQFRSEISKATFLHLTASVSSSEISPISSAFGLVDPKQIRAQLVDAESIETVFIGYSNDQRIAYPFDDTVSPARGAHGKMEIKKREVQPLDMVIPSAPFDLRIGAASETIVDDKVTYPPPSGWSSKRIKRRRGFSVRDSKVFGWRIDLTEVTVISQASKEMSVLYEMEIEMLPNHMKQLLGANDDNAAMQQAKNLSQQLWWLIKNVNPLHDILDVESHLKSHLKPSEVSMAISQCSALRRFSESGFSNNSWCPAVGVEGNGSSAGGNTHFIGCMPVNFSRHNIEEIQRSDGGYYLSEKTDGVRYLMVFTGSAVVLLDRKMCGKQMISAHDEPMKHLIDHIKAGTVLDGEVVMHRKLRRPIFIVFDILVSGTTPLVSQAFKVRLDHLKGVSFVKDRTKIDVYSKEFVKNPSVPLPLILKNFVTREKLDDLLSNVNEDMGFRQYRNGECHHHLTDGIIFQPNRSYVLGTDLHLLKWKYLDTVTIDVEIQKELNNHSDPDVLKLAVLGEENTRVDMTRYVKLPKSELLRLEADRYESGGTIAEVGFDPETGEWYYVTMRPDKHIPNHISTVLGTLLELAESLGTNELRYRMSIPPGVRDNYRKDMKSMQKQLLTHQRKELDRSKGKR